MARQDPTFSAGDLIRFFRSNLTNDEQVEVILFFTILLPIIIEEAAEKAEFLSLEDLIVGLYRGLGRTLVKRLIRQFIPRIRVKQRLISRGFTLKTRIEVEKTISYLTRGGLLARITLFLRGKGVI